MKIKSLSILALIMVTIMLAQIVPAAAQGCSAVGLKVAYEQVDAAGYAPRLKAGSQTQFDCIAGRDPNFASARQPSAWEALNYWFGLVNPATGSALGFLPVPTAD
jgi:hypothetical protein